MNNPKSKPPQNNAQNQVVTELAAMRQELQEIRKEVSILRKNLTSSVASGVVLGFLIIAGIGLVLQLLLNR
ncbi:MAG: hypothetical protein KME06_09590 [Kastovskya adunca ATA6-11-RM4]|jgi:hypothetical protein|nr:hypothetical protein [Kastovskya adunca ATA6-11-RM4]